MSENHLAKFPDPLPKASRSGNLARNHLAVRVSLLVRPGADPTIAVGAEEGLELFLLHLGIN